MESVWQCLSSWLSHQYWDHVSLQTPALAEYIFLPQLFILPGLKLKSPYLRKKIDGQI